MKVEHEYKSVPHNPRRNEFLKSNNRELAKIESDIAEIHAAYMRAVASGDSRKSRVMARAYRLHFEGRK